MAGPTPRSRRSLAALRRQRSTSSTVRARGSKLPSSSGPTRVRQSEADFQRQIIELAELMGWQWFHAWDMIKNTPGFPDLVLLHPEWHRVAFWELKSAIGKPTLDQERWIYALQRVHGQIDAAFLRPADWDRVEAYLTGKATTTQREETDGID